MFYFTMQMHKETKNLTAKSIHRVVINISLVLSFVFIIVFVRQPGQKCSLKNKHFGYYHLCGDILSILERASSFLLVYNGNCMHDNSVQTTWGQKLLDCIISSNIKNTFHKVMVYR